MEQRSASTSTGPNQEQVSERLWANPQPSTRGQTDVLALFWWCVSASPRYNRAVVEFLLSDFLLLPSSVRDFSSAYGFFILSLPCSRLF